MINIEDTFLQRVTRLNYYDETDVFTQEQLNFFVSYSLNNLEPGTYDKYVNISLVHRAYEPDTGNLFNALPDH